MEAIAFDDTQKKQRKTRTTHNEEKATRIPIVASV
jgi:hypothetical protein